MKIVVIGGAGAMARTTVMDLSENEQVKKILVADFQAEKAIEYADSFNDKRIKGTFVDANRTDETADVIQGYDAVINCAQYYVNISVMQACLKGGAHYLDLGGMFHYTRKQLELFNDFKKAGISAVLGMGAAPGITNVLGRYAYDRLDTVEIVRFFDAAADLTVCKSVDAFIPPYSIRTIMEEYSEDSQQFIDGSYQTMPPLSGAMQVEFPQPIGTRTCIHTLHSETATVPESFKDKGVKEVTWRLNLPPEFEKQAQFLASIGFASKELIEIQGCQVAPLEVLAKVVDNHIAEKLKGITIEPDDMECLRAEVRGTKDGRQINYIVDCIGRTHSRWGCSIGEVATGTPPAIVAEMQIKGNIPPGVWAPEQVVDPESLFAALAKREMQVHEAKMEKIT